MEIGYILLNIFGIDYSMNSPGVCYRRLDNDHNVVDSDYRYFSSTTKHIKADQIHCIALSKSHNNLCEKFDIITNHIMSFINSKISADDSNYVGMEGYSYGSVGRVFDIAESTGVMKHKIYLNDITLRLRIYEPSAIKKYGALNGTAGKVEMNDAFVSDVDVNKPVIPEHLQDSESPKADIIDAYWICKLLQTEIGLRRGIYNLKDLHQKRIEIFNSVSKANKENVLVRNFIERVV